MTLPCTKSKYPKIISALLKAAVASLAVSQAHAAFEYHFSVPGLKSNSSNTTPPAQALSPVGDGTSKAGACTTGAAVGCARWTGDTATGNLVSVAVLAGTDSRKTPICRTTGKWYVEMRGNNWGVGVSKVPLAYPVPGYLEALGDSVGYSPFVADSSNIISGFARTTATFISRAAALADNWVGVGFDLDARTVTFIGPLGQQSYPGLINTGCWNPVAGGTTNSRLTLNAGQIDFAYAVPAGYNAGFW